MSTNVWIRRWAGWKASAARNTPTMVTPSSRPATDRAKSLWASSMKTRYSPTVKTVRSE